TPDADGVTRGVTSGTRGTTGFDTISAMVVVAAGRAGQRRFGAKHPYYDNWCRVDDKKLVSLACDLTDKKDKALRLIEGAEQTARNMVDYLWPAIENVARALVDAPDQVLDREDVLWLCRDVERISFRALPREGEGEMDGQRFFWRQDGYLKPFG